jgi:hypothetical protein
MLLNKLFAKFSRNLDSNQFWYGLFLTQLIAYNTQKAPFNPQTTENFIVKQFKLDLKSTQFTRFSWVIHSTRFKSLIEASSLRGTLKLRQFINYKGDIWLTIPEKTNSFEFEGPIFRKQVKSAQTQKVVDFRQLLDAITVNQIQWQVKKPVSVIALEEENTEKLVTKKKPPATIPKPVAASQHPIRPNKPSCPSWIDHGKCRFGKKCLYNHPPRPEPEEIYLDLDEILYGDVREHLEICDKLLVTLKVQQHQPKLTLSNQMLAQLAAIDGAHIGSHQTLVESITAKRVSAVA